ncbi:MAG TPA: DNA ligase D [Thermoanaerobaculia bacterium]|nr:DNA ligase D [Thermoanaerobaculia bacterium]
MARPKRKTPDELRALLRKLSPPMLATLIGEIPADESQWLFELKYDGFRAVAAVSKGEAVLWSRNALDLAQRFPGVVAAAKRIDVGDAVLDGEVVVLDDAGIPRFQLLQKGEDGEAVFFVFDLLWLEGEDLRKRPIEERRALLQKLVGKRTSGAIRLAEQMSGNARAALAKAAAEGHEGLIAKRRGSLYESRRSKAWVKLKAINAQELAVIGYNPSTASASEIGSLLLGVVDDGKMRYAGKVGTGYSAKQRTELKKILDRDRVSKPDVLGAPRMKGVVWVEPKLVAQVRFTEWTDDAKLRHPSFLGLRPDKSPWDVVRERAAAAPASGAKEKKTAKAAAPARKARAKAQAKKASAPASLVALSNPDRLVYPRDRITKKDVADYYQAVSEPMIRALAGRPLALEHWNDGINKPSWFHQSIKENAEEPWMTIVETPARTSSRSVRHLVADSPAALQWLAQRSALTIHMWSAHVPSLESPDWVVFDLDPAKGKGIEQAIEAAMVFRRLLEKLELPSVPKTSGKRGIHVLVPLVPGYSHEDALEFACRIAGGVAKQVPEFTTERSLANRKGRLYLDCMQNGYGKTIVAPYSLRAIDGAPVSAPLEWSEVTPKLDPSKFNLRTMPERLAKKGDLFRAAIEGGAKLPRFR